MAEFIDQYGSLIRRRVRSKLSLTMRRVFDSQDVLSSLARRLDVVVAKGQLRAMNEAQFMGFVHQVAQHAIVDQARVSDRLRRVEDPEGEIVRLMRARLLDGDDRGPIRMDELARILESVPSGDQKDIVCMWMNGRNFKSIAETLGLSHAAVRQRWCQLRKDLRLLLGTGEA